MTQADAELVAAGRALWSLRRAKGITALAPIVGVALWQTSLTDHIGYGASLVLALVGSVVAALLGASLPFALRSRGEHPRGAVVALCAVLTGLSWVALAALVVAARALLTTPCSPSQGALALLLVTLPGVALAALCGVGIGGLVARQRVALGLALALVPTFVAWSLARFYATPTIFAYDPFFGFFPGAIYDEDVPLGATLLSYRVGTAGWIVALASLLSAHWDAAQNRLRHNGFSLITALLGVPGALVGAGVFTAGSALGHRHDAAQLADALGASAWSRRCVVRYDRAIPPAQARLMARDCDLRLAQLEDFFGVREPRRVTVFLFSSPEQKQALMGAAHTYIAKPWRAEVYLQYEPSPHPVLKHELAHVVAGRMAPGPLQVSARGRLLPVPGLIEGAAVAAAWEGEGDASPHAWSRAMLAAGIAPRVSSLTSLGFFAASSATAYTAAGSFCRWLHATHGAARFRALYVGADFRRAYGQSLSSLERDWHRFLRERPADPRLVARARARFFRASIFGRACPFDVERIAATAAAAMHGGALDDALRGYEAVLRLDPTSLAARTALAALRVRRGERAQAEAIAQESARVAGPAAAQRVRSAIADALWRWGALPEARRAIESLDPQLMGDAELRTHEIKREALARGGALEPVVRALLVGHRELAPSAVVAVARVRASLEGDPLARYLVARQLALHERHDDALALLPAPDAVVNAPLRAELARLRGVSLYHLGRLDESAAMFRRIADDPERPDGARDLARDWLDRVRRSRDVP